MASSGDSEEGVLNAFLHRLREVNVAGNSIHSLSSMIRGASPRLFPVLVEQWRVAVSQESEGTKILALIYVANDVLQLLRPSSSETLFSLHSATRRYAFAVPLIAVLANLHHICPSILPKVHRVVTIWRERHVLDTFTLDLLESAVTGGRPIEELMSAMEHHVATQKSRAFPLLQQETSAKERRIIFEDWAEGLSSEGESDDEIHEEDLDADDLSYLKRLREIVRSVHQLWKGAREKQVFGEKMSAQQQQLGVLMKKEYILRCDLTRALADLLERLDLRQAELVTKLEDLEEIKT